MSNVIWIWLSGAAMIVFLTYTGLDTKLGVPFCLLLVLWASYIGYQVADWAYGKEVQNIDRS